MFDIDDKIEREIDSLKSLRDSGHDEIDGYAAEEYIDEAITNLEAALQDVKEGRK